VDGNSRCCDLCSMLGGKDILAAILACAYRTLCVTVATYPGLLTPLFVACSTNAGEGLVRLIMCSDIPGRWVDVWRSGTFSEKKRRM